MIPLRYSAVRWAIVAIGAILVAFWYLSIPPVGMQVFLGFLLVLTAMPWIVPPGIYGWLIRAVCPTCGKRVEWAAVQPDDKPYQEQLTIRCPGCGKSRVEWQYLS